MKNKKVKLANGDHQAYKAATEKLVESIKNQKTFFQKKVEKPENT